MELLASLNPPHDGQFRPSHCSHTPRVPSGLAACIGLIGDQDDNPGRTGGSGVLAYTLGSIVIVIGWTGSAILNRRAAKSRPRPDQPEISEPR